MSGQPQSVSSGIGMWGLAIVGELVLSWGLGAMDAISVS
jgi:hypothetical protein